MKRTLAKALTNVRLAGPKGFAFPPAPRCPACESTAIEFRTALVDEARTFAIKPQQVASDDRTTTPPYRYQEYRYLQCEYCWLTWFVEPTGRWSTKPDRLTSEPHGSRPLRLVDEAKQPVREPLDYQRSERRRTGRFSDVPLAQQVVSSPVMILTGAGASVPFGFGAARGYQFPERERLTLDGIVLQQFLSAGSMTGYLKKPQGRQLLSLAEAYTKDMEILLEVLLRLQQMILHEGSDSRFSEVLPTRGFTCSSWFVFDEAGGTGNVYPPLTRSLANAAFREAIESSVFFRETRELLQSVCLSIMATYGPPTEEGLAAARRLLNPLLERLRRLLPGPLPFFTTNFDQVVETMLAPQGEHLYDGFAHEPSAEVRIRDHTGKSTVAVPLYAYTPKVLEESTRGDVCLFHMHGSSQYFVEAGSGELYSAAARRSELRALHSHSWASATLIPGAILPATCKDRYLFTPPFALAYDYLRATLQNAKVCVIIGQSGRDHALKQLLYGAARDHKRITFLVVDYREGLPPHLGDALAPGRVEFWGRGLNDDAVDWIVRRVTELLRNSC